MGKQLSRRDFLKLGLAVAAMAAFRPLPGTEMRQIAETFAYNPQSQVTPPDSNNARKYSPLTLLAANRLTFGARQSDLDWIERNGVDAFIEEQLAFDQIDDSVVNQRLQNFSTLNLLPTDPAPTDESNVLLELQGATLLRAVYSQRQLYELIVDFWSNHFNVHFNSPSDYILKTIDDRDVVRKYGMSKFRDLLGASAHSPAMLVSLNNSLSVKKQPNENYARELMEQHTIGVDGDFTEKDVAEVARSFTGWMVEQFIYKKPIVGTFNYLAANHDEDPKVVLGHRLPAYGGVKDGEKVLDILASTPACAALISTKLVQRFISDNPPASAVQKGMDAFQSSQGDIRATLGAILHSQEFKSSTGLKVKRPLDYAVSALRALNAETDAGRPIQSFILRLGQPLFLWPLPDGYPDTAEDWVNSGGMLARWNFAKALVGNSINGTHIELKGLASQTGNMIEDLSQAILFGSLPSDMVGALNLLTDPKKMPELAALLIASPFFQVRG